MRRIRNCTQKEEERRLLPAGSLCRKRRPPRHLLGCPAESPRLLQDRKDSEAHGAAGACGLAPRQGCGPVSPTETTLLEVGLLGQISA